MPPGASGARAWGFVNSNGVLLRSKQVTAVTHPDTGDYCIDPAPGIDHTTAVLMVGEEFDTGVTSSGTDNVSQAEWMSSGFNCPFGTMAVLTWRGDGSPASSTESDLGGFDLTTEDVGFTFVIP